jgi:hypothetical protein
MKRILCRPDLICFFICCGALLVISTAAQNIPEKSPDRIKLSVFLGHWEGAGNFLDTKMSKAQIVHSVADCTWSPQRTALVCEQHQITIFTVGTNGNFSYTTLNPDGRLFNGMLTISGNQWTFTAAPGTAAQYPQFRTVNTFNGNEETFFTEFTEDGSHWTTMLKGTMHRLAHPSQNRNSPHRG